jgi:hypothetical protein
MPLAEITPARAARTGQPARKLKPADESPFTMRDSSDMTEVRSMQVSGVLDGDAALNLRGRFEALAAV